MIMQFRAGKGSNQSSVHFQLREQETMVCPLLPFSKSWPGRGKSAGEFMGSTFVFLQHTARTLKLEVTTPGMTEPGRWTPLC